MLCLALLCDLLLELSLVSLTPLNSRLPLSKLIEQVLEGSCQYLVDLAYQFASAAALRLVCQLRFSHSLHKLQQNSRGIRLMAHFIRDLPLQGGKLVLKHTENGRHRGRLVCGVVLTLVLQKLGDLKLLGLRLVVSVKGLLEGVGGSGNRFLAEFFAQGLLQQLLDGGGGLDRLFGVA